MGHAVQVDPDVIVAQARRLAEAAGALVILAGRTTALTEGATAAAAAPELAAALAQAGSRTARRIGHEAAGVDALGRATGAGGASYRALEQAMAARWSGGSSRWDGTDGGGVR